jgi:hypothetical protein
VTKDTAAHAEMMAETFLIISRVLIKEAPQKNKIIFYSATIYILMLPFA